MNMMSLRTASTGFMFSLMNDTRNCIKSVTHQVFLSTAVRILYYPRRILCILVSQNEQILRHERPNRTIKQHLQYTTPTTQATTTTTRKRAVTVRVRPHLLDPSAPLAAPPRGPTVTLYESARRASLSKKSKL